MRLERGDGIRHLHSRHEAHVDLGDGLMRQYRFSTRTRIATNETLDIDRRLRYQALVGRLP